jgi:predicted HTH domain antitoxin
MAVLPEAVEKSLTPADVALHLALGLFVAERMTLGQAAEVAGLSQPAFMQELGRRKISIHYGAEELAEDMRTVESLS